MNWRPVLDVVDAVESWIAGQSFWVQAPLLIAVLLSLSWLLAGVIDRVVERVLWRYTRREVRAAAAAAIADREPSGGRTG